MVALNEDVTLLTIRARRDPAFPGELFMLVRTYRRSDDPGPTTTMETVSIEDALVVVETWLRTQGDSGSVTPQ